MFVCVLPTCRVYVYVCVHIYMWNRRVGSLVIGVSGVVSFEMSQVWIDLPMMQKTNQFGKD